MPHTPGPWGTDGYRRIECEVEHGSPWDRLEPAGERPNVNGKGVAFIAWVAQRPDHEGHGDQLHSAEARANAALIAAAPDLLNACELAMRYLTRLHERSGMRLEGEEAVGNTLLNALQRAQRA